MNLFIDDLRQAIRALVRRPGLAAAIVLPLALGIGANSAIFGVVDAVLFRQLPVNNADRLARVYTVLDGTADFNPSSYPTYTQFRDRAPAFSGLAAFSNAGPVHLSVGGGAAERVSCSLVTGNYFEVLGVVANRGRLLTAADDGAPGADPVVVMSDRLWRRRFGANAVIGSALRVNGREFIVVGVAQAGFAGIDFDNANGIPDLWAPTSMVDAVLPEYAEGQPLTSRGFGWLEMVGRLTPGATLAHVETQLDGISAALDSRAATANRTTSVRVLPAIAASLDPTGNGQATRLAWLLFGIVVCVLLIACADAAGLLLARAEERKREVAIRQALGASRARIARELLAESLVLSGLSAVVGLTFAVWLSSVLVALAPPGFVLPIETASSVMGTRVLLFTVSAAVLTGMLVGIVPAVDGWRTALAPALNDATGFVSIVGRRFRIRYSFVVFQVALSAVLLVGTGLLLRTLWNAYRVDLGFNPSHLLIASVDLGKQYTMEQRVQVLDRILGEVRALPGVRAAAAARTPPLNRSVSRTGIEIDGVDIPGNERVDLNVVGPDFFGVLGVPVLRGRAFTSFDDKRSPAIVVVNQAFADRYLAATDPTGTRVRGAPVHGIGAGSGAEIVGVAANFRQRSLREPRRPMVFVAASQFDRPSPRMSIVMRTAADPTSLVEPLRAAVARIDPDLALFDVRTAGEQRGLALGQERLVAGLLVAFALIALLLAATGFYALFSYLARLRAREFAIRAALGAGRRELVGLVIGKSAMLATSGIAVGLMAAIALSRVLAHLLFDVAPLDTATFAASALLLLAVPTLASYIPAHRAARVDPARSLRGE